jgi:hypothetical protein
MFHINRIRTIIASAFFLLWLSVLYAGADHPPPPGFVLIVALVVVCSAIVWLRVRRYYQWTVQCSRLRWLRAALDGIAAGAVIGLLVMLTTGGGTSVQPRLVDRVKWVAVSAIVGMLNSVLAFGVAAWLTRRSGREES